MVGTFLKLFGVIILIGGVLGLFIGVFTILYGAMEPTDPDPVGVAGTGQARSDAGVAIVGGSFLLAGAGLVVLVAGLSASARERAARAPRRSVVAGPPRVQ